jgi:hypothetical protein
VVPSSTQTRATGVFFFWTTAANIWLLAGPTGGSQNKHTETNTHNCVAGQKQADQWQCDVQAPPPDPNKWIALRTVEKQNVVEMNDATHIRRRTAVRFLSCRARWTVSDSPAMGHVPPPTLLPSSFKFLLLTKKDTHCLPGSHPLLRVSGSGGWDAIRC